MTWNWGRMARKLTETVQEKKNTHNPWAVIQIWAGFQSQNSLASREARSLWGQILREEVPRTFICVTMNWGKDNTQLFQILLDMGSQLILTSRYPKCYHTLITCVLSNRVAQVQLIMGLQDPQSHLVDIALNHSGPCQSYSSKNSHAEHFLSNLTS